MLILHCGYATVSLSDRMRKRVLDTLEGLPVLLVRTTQLMIVTGIRARRVTVSATLPRSVRLIPERPWLPMTT